MDEHALRTLGRMFAVVLDVDRVRRDVQTHDLAEVVHVERQARAVAFADVVVLRRKRVALDGPRVRAADGADECQPRERRPLGLVIFERQVAKAKELPPRGLVLAPVPLEEVCHEPTRLLILGALRGIDGHLGEQVVHHALRLSGRSRDVLARDAARELRAGQVDAVLVLRLRAQPLEPVAQLPRRDAVFAVVALDGRDVLGETSLALLAAVPLGVRHGVSCRCVCAGGIAGFRLRAERELELRPRRHLRRAVAQRVRRVDRQLLVHLDGPLDRATAQCRRAQVLLSIETVEPLELLDRIALDAGAQRVAHDRVQVDEELGA